MSSRARARLAAPAAAASVRPSLNWYREEWEGFGLVASGREAGLTVPLSASRPARRYFCSGATLSITHMPRPSVAITSMLSRGCTCRSQTAAFGSPDPR